MHEEFDILFLCGILPKEKEDDFINNSKGFIQNAANNLQWELIRGLDQNLDNNLTLINSPYIGSYPTRYKKINIKTFSFSHNNISKDINVGFLNLSGIKQLSRYISLKPHIKKWSLSSNSRRKVIIAYAMTSTFTHTIRFAKKINSDIISCLVVPDLPNFMRTDGQKNIFYDLIKNINFKIIKGDMNYIDSYVLLTKEMKNMLKINKPYVVIEGISTTSFNLINEKKNSYKTVLYSGGLSVEYGVLDLISAFISLKNDSFRLIICGSGKIEDEILKMCERDQRIIFKGLINREEVLKLQTSASILINPRNNKFLFTKYSFPSKILEYMSSGTPVLAYKLDGIPTEYYEYMYVIPEHHDGLRSALENILNMDNDELKIFGLKAKEFVQTNKNSKVQTKKIILMLENISNSV